MKMSVLVLAFTASIVSVPALAHPEGHEFDMKPLATTCDELAYPHRYEVDTAYPEIKALVAKCEAASKAAARDSSTKAKASTTAKPAKTR